MNTQHERLITTVLLLILVTFFALLPGVAFAQGPDVVRADVDRTQLSTDESLVLTITVNGLGSEVSAPQLPSLDGFTVIGQSSSSQISILNGDMRMSAVYQYRLQPTQTGELVIDTVTVTGAGQTYGTEPLRVQVTPGSGNRQQGAKVPSVSPPAISAPELNGQDFFVEAELANPTPYQGEQTTYIFRLYQAVRAGGKLDYTAPSFSGFWHEQDAEQTRYQVQVAGRTYQVTELRHVLFPTISGDIAIEPATLLVPGGFFSRGQVLSTQPLTVQVQSLPPDAPADFNGAVGQFTMQASTDRRDARVGDAVTLQLQLSGWGNIDTLASPVISQSDAWRSIAGDTTIQTKLDGDRYRGTRLFDWTLIPTQTGELSIPSFAYSYFDPSTATYQSLTTEPIAVSVVAGPTEEAMAETVEVQPAAGASQLRTLKSVEGTLAKKSPPLIHRPTYWLLWFVPVALVSAQWIWQRRQQRWQQTASQRRRKTAAIEAQKSLDRVQGGDQGKAVSGILMTYLAAKLDQPFRGLTHAQLATLLVQRGISPELVQEVIDQLKRNETQRFAPVLAELPPDQLVWETRQLVERLEKTLPTS